jgi:hypothetical protein
MNSNSVKYLQGINFSQLTLAENAEIKNLGRATTVSVISQLSARRIQTMWQNLTQLYMLNISSSVAVLKEKLLAPAPP